MYLNFDNKTKKELIQIVPHGIFNKIKRQPKSQLCLNLTKYFAANRIKIFFISSLIKLRIKRAKLNKSLEKHCIICFEDLNDISYHFKGTNVQCCSFQLLEYILQTNQIDFNIYTLNPWNIIDLKYLDYICYLQNASERKMLYLKYCTICKDLSKLKLLLQLEKIVKCQCDIIVQNVIQIINTFKQSEHSSDIFIQLSRLSFMTLVGQELRKMQNVCTNKSLFNSYISNIMEFIQVELYDDSHFHLSVIESYLYS